MVRFVGCAPLAVMISAREATTTAKLGAYFAGSPGEPAQRNNARMPTIPDLPFTVVQYTGARALGCFTCAHWWGEFNEGGHVICQRDHPWLHVQGVAESGCCHWMRATGGDDQCE